LDTAMAMDTNMVTRTENISAIRIKIKNIDNKKQTLF